MITLKSVFIVLSPKVATTWSVADNPSGLGVLPPLLDVLYYSKQYPKSQVIMTILDDIV
ncbi:hypothetical protein [Moraxella lincolnii]|uniref:hypothetical protein n=1 Tax=Lwoffella lincolnii TaxID=90241 RepID=UPI0013016F1A|nr:hypothetical protein [Moraxella lincolnii]